jgi:NAD(P)-dependent dehydrogenase (short-subunit alcohol dehydrogenase family)
MNNKAINEVQEKVAIVTGAASGIGRATVELLQARGALVVAEDINPAVKDIFKGHDRIVPLCRRCGQRRDRPVGRRAHPRTLRQARHPREQRGHDYLQARRGHDAR